MPNYYDVGTHLNAPLDHVNLQAYPGLPPGCLLGDDVRYMFLLAYR